jgi:hypothetical protein
MRRKKYTSKKSTPKRRGKRRMGAISGGMSTALFTILGGVAARFVTNALNSTTAIPDTYKQYVAAGAPLLAGYFLPKFVKNEMGKNLGLGMIAVGGLELVQATGALAGLPIIAGMHNMQMGLNPTTQNPRGTIAGMSTKTAAILAS